jgi:hypothetical protein
MGNWPVVRTPEANGKYHSKVTILAAKQVHTTPLGQLISTKLKDKSA